MEVLNLTTNDLNSDAIASSFNNEKCIFLLNNEELVKIYRHLSETESFILNRNLDKINTLSDIKELNIPTLKVYYNNKLVGFTSKFYQDSEVFINSFPFIKTNEEYINYLKQMSNVLKQLHSKDITLGDFTYSNILLGKEGLKFIDFEFCGINGAVPFYFSTRAANYVKRYNEYFMVNSPKEFDKLALMIEFLCFQFESYCFNDKLMEDNFIDLIIRTNMNDKFVKAIKDTINYFSIENITNRKCYPYLGDVIENEDLYNNKIRRLKRS